MSMVTGELLVRLLLIGLGGYLFLYLFWKSLKDEMDERSIFAHGLIIVTASIVTSIVFSKLSALLPATRIFVSDGLWLWGAFVGFSSASVFTWYFSPFPANYLLEVIVPAALLWLIFVGAVFQSAISVMGFSALVTLAFFFTVKAIIAVVAPSVIFSIGRVEVLFSLSIVFLSVFSLYHLSQP